MFQSITEHQQGGHTPINKYKTYYSLLAQFYKWRCSSCLILAGVSMGPTMTICKRSKHVGNLML